MKQPTNPNKEADPTIPYPVASVLADNRYNWKTLICTLVAFLWDFVIFYLYLTKTIHVVFLIFFHIVLLNLLAYFVYKSYQQKEDLRYPLLLLIGIFGMGPAGALGILIFMLLRPLFSWAAVPFSTWFQDLFPEKENIFKNPYIRIQAGWDDYTKPAEVIPFLDVFQHGSLHQKQMVLDQVATHYTPTYAPLLQSALTDSSNVIRIQAAAIEAKIEHDFEVKLKELLRDKNLKDPKTLLLLAGHYEYYTYLNVLPPARERATQERALEYYTAYLEKEPKDKKALMSKGRLLERMDNDQGVIDWFEQLPEEMKDRELNIYPWYLQALYRLGHYETVTTVAQKILPALEKAHWPKDIMENIVIWRGAAHG